MPELPEVETVARDLRPMLIGRRFLAVVRSNKALRKSWKKDWEKQLVGQVVRTIDRRGKWLAICLDGGGVLQVHLGMTGQLTVEPPDTPVEDHTHFRLELDRGGELRFRDVRRFGSLTFFPSHEEWTKSLVGHLGPEPWEISPSSWREAVAGSRRNLKAILLDQTIVAGVGNIYADESCFRARLDPRRLGFELSEEEADRLLNAIRAVLTRAIESRGSSIRDYIGGSRLKGEFQEEFAAYGRTDQPCLVCETPIMCVRLAGRSTHFCPQCQAKNEVRSARAKRKR